MTRKSLDVREGTKPSKAGIRARFDRNNVIQFVGLLLFIPAIGLMLTLVPRANPVTGNDVSATAPGAVDPSNAGTPSSEGLEFGPDSSVPFDEPSMTQVETPYIPPSAEESAAAADSINVLAPADRPAPPSLVVQAPPANLGSTPRPSAAPPTAAPVSPSSLAAPTGVSASNSNTIGIDVKWNAVSSATRYHLYRGVGSAQPAYYRTITGRTGFGDDANAGTYTYYVTAANGSKTSAPSSLTRPITVGGRVSAPVISGSQDSSGVITISPKALGADKHNLYRDNAYQTTINGSASFKVQPSNGTHKYYVVGINEESSGPRFSERSNELTFTWPK